MIVYRVRTRIDELMRPDHPRLEPDDRCWFFGDYEPGGDFASPTNSLILNLKKSPARRGRPEWLYKQRAIVMVARSLTLCVKHPERYLFVPMPPSKRRDDPLYDARLVDVLGQPLLTEHGFRFADGLSRVTSTTPRHLSNDRRPAIADLVSELSVDTGMLKHAAEGRRLVVFDDVITTGAQFKAAQHCLGQALDRELRAIRGLFIARRVIRPFDFDDYEF